MKKKNVANALAVVVCLVFTVIYFLIFGSLKANPKIKVEDELLVTQEVKTNLTETTLYWLQLGIFKQTSSFEEIKNKCEANGYPVTVVNFSDKMAVVVGITNNESDLNQAKETMKLLGLEFMVKSYYFNSNSSLSAISSNNYAQALSEAYS